MEEKSLKKMKAPEEIWKQAAERYPAIKVCEEEIMKAYCEMR